MSVLTDLRAALDANRGCDERCIACVPSPCERVYDLLDLDTIAALVAVAEAVDKGKLTAARHSLYPLVKEATDE